MPDFSAVPMMISDLERGAANGGAHMSAESLRLVAASLRRLSEAAGLETPPPYDPEAD